jgi:uridine kinase
LARSGSHLRPELSDLWDFRIFVEIDAAESLRRGPPRDQAWMGSFERASERYRTIYLPGEQHYLDVVGPLAHADVVLDNRDPALPVARQPGQPLR